MKPKYIENTLVEVTEPYSQLAGIIGRFFRLCWAPIAYVFGLSFHL